jgi:hypothetical protein
MGAQHTTRIRSQQVGSNHRSPPVLSAPAHEREVSVGAAAAVRDGCASTPSATQVLRLQHFAGNQVVARLLRSRDRIARRAVVQRNEKSAKRLKKLATPQVLDGPRVKVQDDIVNELEKQIAPLATTKEQELKYVVTCLGGIELGTTPGDLKTLIDTSKLYDLPQGERSIGISTYALAVQAGVTKHIVENTLATMDAAGQLDYLRESGLIDKDWKVVVEIHYYRDRNPEQTKFHKDSTGQTLFVNLNFTNEETVAGPEVVINPASSPEYEQRLEKGSYTNAQSKRNFKLPEVFVEDLKHAKQELGDPEEFLQTIVKPKQFVAFVDEAVHHKTPTLGHRTISSEEIGYYLQRKYKKLYTDASDAYTAYSKRSIFAYGYGYASYLKEKDNQKHAEFWLAFFTHKAKLPEERYNRKRLPTLFDWPDFLDQKTLVDELIEEGGSKDFGEAEFRHAGLLGHPVKKQGKPPLRRQRSEMELKGTAPKVVPGKRRFFRTWVRAVPRNPSTTSL